MGRGAFERAMQLRREDNREPGFADYLQEVFANHTTKETIENLHRSGYHGPTGQVTSNNEMYRAREHIEGEIIQGTIETLQTKYGLFSHALIHDAMLIHNDILNTVVLSEFKDNLS